MKLQETIIDKVVSYFAPIKGAQRLQARVGLNEAKRYYEGAQNTRRTSGWKAPATGPISSQNGLSRLRDRSRSLRRNNPYAFKAIEVIASDVVGTGVTPQISDKNENNAELIQDLWNEWSESIDCDADGLLSFIDLEEKIVSTVVDSGEILVRYRPRRSSDNLLLPFQIQLIEADYIDTTKNETLNNGSYIVQGVEFDVRGKRKAYWLFEDHPGDMSRTRSYQSKRVSSKNIDHIFRIDRVGQVRGVPWAAPVMLTIKDFDDYEDAQLMRQKIASCFSAFVFDTAGASTPAQEKQNKDKYGSVSPGRIEVLGAGKDIKFASPPSVDGYAEYTKEHKLKIAAGYGVTYEALTGDYSNVNFSSGRMGWLQYNRSVVKWQRQLLVSRFCSRTAKEFLKYAALAGFNVDNARFKWSTPRREMIDPVKETMAIVTQVRGGLKSRKRAITELGYNPKDIREEIIADNQADDADNIIVDTDPRKTSSSGSIQDLSKLTDE